MAPHVRIRRAQAELHERTLDALVVTHPPNIRYLTGLNASAGACLLTATACTLVVDFRYATAADDVAAKTGIGVVVAETSVDETVAAQVRGSGPKRIAIEAAHLSVARFHRLIEALRPAVLIPCERLIEQLRVVKDSGEIEILRRAGHLISSVAREARTWVVPGAAELDVAAAIDAAMRQAGFERPAFETIVASGPNGALPHARPTRRRLAAGDGVVLDFGGVYDGYCVDLTRTLRIGEGTPEFRRMFEAVREAQAAAIAAVVPGAAAADIDGAARRTLEGHGLGAAFGHGTGHGLGLEVHEEPRISKTAPPGEVVRAGMVFTIEPGAYVPGIGGVRIEDDVLVVNGGCELLTDVPIEL
jgi:Xaa-Pro aminopeptidase